MAAKKVVVVDIGGLEKFSFSETHPMDLGRASAVTKLLDFWGIDVTKVTVVERADLGELYYNTTAYIAALQGPVAGASPDFFPNDDSPAFEGMDEYVGLVVAGSREAVDALVTGRADIATFWAGGLHHGQPGRAFGFCYVNDLVYIIDRLLRSGKQRVLYIDIDIHHGDGVEAAYKGQRDTGEPKADKKRKRAAAEPLWSRVWTLSFHYWKNDDDDNEPFFPGTGGPADVRVNIERFRAINVPLRNSISGPEYVHIFTAVTEKTFDVMGPNAVVMQCGADSIAGDMLGQEGNFNLSIREHARCVEFVKERCKKAGVPLLVTGGGGYTPAITVRSWAYITAMLSGQEDQARSIPSTVLKDSELCRYLGSTGSGEVDLGMRLDARRADVHPNPTSSRGARPRLITRILGLLGEAK